MNTLEPRKCYSPIEPQSFLDKKVIIFKIEKANFEGEEYREQDEFVFYGCKFENIIIENTEQIEQIGFEKIRIVFNECLIKNIRVDKIQTKNISLRFLNSIISGEIRSDKLSSVSLHNTVVYNYLFLYNQNLVTVSYTKHPVYPMRWRKLFEYFPIKNISELLKLEQSYSIWDTKKVVFIRMELPNERREFIKDDSARKGEPKFRDQLRKKRERFFNLNLSIIYEKAKAIAKAIEQAEVEIRDFSLNSLLIVGEQRGTIEIENTKIQHWDIYDYTIKGEAVFYDIQPLSKLAKSSIAIHESNLDKSRFDHVRFDEYNTVSFYRTSFYEAKFFSCNFSIKNVRFEEFKALAIFLYEIFRFSDKNPNNYYPDNYYKDQHEIFLQLRNALESNGNIHESQKLHAIANEALREVKDVGIEDKLILWINSRSNNHGFSIKRPLLWFFGGNIVLYILYLCSLNLGGLSLWTLSLWALNLWTLNSWTLNSLALNSLTLNLWRWNLCKSNLWRLILWGWNLCKSNLWRLNLWGLILWALILWALNRIFNSNKEDWQLIGYYFSFINVTHPTDFLVDKCEQTALSSLIDFLNRIFSSFFIYQFITVFRKFRKK